jgi:ribosome-binding factor A
MVQRTPKRAVKMGEVRKRRIESTIKEIIGTMILRHDIKDPRLNDLVCITNVEVSKDTKYARIFVSYFGEPEICTNAVETLNHAAGLIQSVIGQKVHLRNTPKLLFIEDHSIEKGFRITQRLKEISPHQPDPEDSSGDTST